jgi:hypothetical protein
LVAASPCEPAFVVPARVRVLGAGGEQAFYLGDGQRDHAGVERRGLVRGDRGRRLGIGAVPELGGGDGADGQGGHDEHDVAQDRGVEPGLALVQAEAVLPELEILLAGYVGS